MLTRLFLENRIPVIPVIDTLNMLLAGENEAHDFYMAFKNFAELHGYKKLAEFNKHILDEEESHVIDLTKRIKFLGGTPIFNTPRDFPILDNVQEQLNFELQKEYKAIEDYKKSINICIQENDLATKILLDKILKDEDEHTFEIQEKLTQIKDVGVDNFLTLQV